MYRFTYPTTLTPDEQDGGLVVTFRDLPEAITQGDSQEQALAEAVDCLEEAVAGRIDDGSEIPVPSAPAADEHLVSVPVQMALKAALYLAMREKSITKSDLARRLHANEKEARRILDPHHGTKATTLERALAALGKQAQVTVL